MNILRRIGAWLNPPPKLPSNEVAMRGLDLFVITSPATEVDQNRSIQRIHRLRQHLHDRPDLDNTLHEYELNRRLADLAALGVSVPDKEAA